VQRATACLRAVEQDLEILEHRLQEKLQPYAAELTLLDEIPGVDATLAAGIIAEMGGGYECLRKRFSAGILGRDLSWQ
jgi:transposase